MMETLVILFILYSIFQFFYENKKKKNQKPRRRPNRTAGPQTAGGEPLPKPDENPKSWEDVMKELESVFTGEPAETQEQKRARREAEFKRPEPQSIQRPAESAGERDRRYESSARYERFEEDSYWEQQKQSASQRESALDRARRGKDLDTGDEPGLAELAEDENNPIFGGATTDTDDPRKGGVSRAAATSLIHRIKDPSSAAQAIIMKEILDKPMARRRTARHTF
ncbi:MAG: hypothetical protein ACOC2C_06805 [Cyclonatronaceae bacterium]